MKPNQRPSNSSSDQELTNDLRKDLESKSIEELIYIHYNQEEYINDYTKKYSTGLNDLMNETNNTAGKGV